MTENNKPFQGHTVAAHNKRFVNFLTDTLICYFLTLGLGQLGTVLYNSYGFDAFVLGEPRWDNWKFSLGNTMVLIVYYGLFESLTQRTIGKYITGTKVVYFNGAKPGEGAILLRSVCRQIPLEALSFLGPYGIGWHDMLSKTLVIDLYKSTQPPNNDFTDNTQP